MHLVVQELRAVYTQIHVWSFPYLLTQHPLCSSRSNFNFKLRIYLFFCCAGSSLLCGLFSGCSEWARLSVCGVGSLLRWPPLWGSGSRHMGVSSCGPPGSSAQGQQSWGTGLVAPWRVGSSWIRDRTCISCIGRWILYHCATREALMRRF